MNIFDLEKLYLNLKMYVMIEMYLYYFNQTMNAKLFNCIAINLHLY